jgi:hypothetical protein
MQHVDRQKDVTYHLHIPFMHWAYSKVEKCVADIRIILYYNVTILEFQVGRKPTEECN